MVQCTNEITISKPRKNQLMQNMFTQHKDNCLAKNVHQFPTRQLLIEKYTFT